MLEKENHKETHSKMADSELQMQLEQQQLMIEQLKELIRQRDSDLDKKEKELLDASTKLSKMKLQNKAKQARMTRMEEAKKELLEEKTDAAEGHKEEVPASQANRAKMTLLKKRLEEKDRVIGEKDEVIKIREQQIEAKERVLAERELFTASLREQLEDKTKMLENVQAGRTFAGGDANSEAQVQAMFAQMMYKDRLIMELNNKILEQDRKVMDLQELAGEKQEVIRGRDKVIEILQATIKEKEQNFHDHTALIARLTARIESNEEAHDITKENLRKAEQQLKSETERFHIKLTETQKYFEEMLAELDADCQQLKNTIKDKDKDIATRENDLREVILRHEQDIQRIMSKEEVNIQDEIIRMFEQKLKDTNDVLEGKVRVIEILQKETVDKEKELQENKDALKILREKLQVTSEQLMLLQANFVDKENEWREEKQRLEVKMHDAAEKHELELSEKELQIQTLRSSLQQYESAYNQAAIQYSALQERYQQAFESRTKHLTQEQAVPPAGTSDPSPAPSSEGGLQEALDRLQTELQVKAQQLEEARKIAAEGGGKSETKLLKLKAQAASKIRALEKELQELRQGSALADEVVSLRNKVAELEDEKGNLQLKLVDFEETKAALTTLEACIKDLEASRVQAQQEQIQMAADMAGIVDERNKYSQIVADLQMQTENLMEQAGALKEEIRSLEASRQELQGDKVSLEVRMAELEEQREALEKEKGELYKEIEKWQERVEYEKQPNIAFEKENEEMRRQVAELQGGLVEEQALNKQQKDEVNHLTAELHGLQDEQSALKQDHEALKSELQAVKEALEEARMETQKLQMEAQNLQAKVDDAELQLEHAARKHQKEMEDLLKEKDLLVDAVRRLESSLEAADHGRQDAEAQRWEKEADLQNKLAAAQEQHGGVTAELQKQLAVRQEQVDKLEAELAERNSLVSELELQVKQMTREAEVLREGQSEKGKEFETKTQSLLVQLSELESELMHQQALSGKFEEEVARLNYELQDKQQTVDSLTLKLTELSSMYEQQEATLTQQTNELTSLGEEVRRLREDGARFKETVAEHEAQRDGELKDRENVLSHVTAQLNKALSDLEEEKARLRNSEADVAELQMQLQKKDLEIQRMQNSMEELQSALSEKVTTCVTLQEDLERLTQEKESLESEHQHAQTQCSELLVAQKQMQQEAETLKRALEEKAERLDALMQSVDEGSSSTQELLQAKDLEIQNLVAQLDQFRSSLEQQQEELELLKNSLGEKEKMLLEKRGQVELLAAEVNSQWESRCGLESGFRQAKERMSAKDGLSRKDRQKTEEEAGTQVSALHEEAVQVMVLTKQLESSHHEGDSPQAPVSPLRNHIDSLEAENAHLREILQKKEKIIQGLHVKKKHAAAKSQHVEPPKTTEPVKSIQQEEKMTADHMTTSSFPSLQSSSLASEQFSGLLSLKTPSDKMIGGQQVDEVFQCLLQEKQYLIIERDTMKEMCSEKDAEIIQLQTKFYDAEYHWKEVMAAKEMEIAQLLKRFHGEEDTSHDLQDENEALEQKLKETVVELQLISKELDSVKHQSDEDNQKIQELLEDVQQLRSENLQLSQQLDSSTECSRQQQEMITFLQSQLQKDTQSQQLSPSSPKDRDSSLEREKERLSYEVRNLQAQVSSLKENLGIMEMERQGRSEHLKTYMSRCQRMEETLMERAAEADDLKKKLAEKDQQLGVMEDVMKGMLGEKDADQKAVSSLSSELESVRIENTALKKELSDLQKIVKKREARLVKLTKQLKDAKTPEAHLQQAESSSETGSSVFGSQHLLGSMETLSSGMIDDSGIRKMSDGSEMVAETDVLRGNLPLAKSQNPEIESLRQALASKAQQLVAAQAELEDVRKQIKRKDAKLLSLTKKLNSSEASPALKASSNSREKVDTLADTPSKKSSPSTTLEDFQEVVREKDQLEMLLRDTEESLHQADERNDILEQDLEELEIRLHRVEQERGHMESDLMDLQAIVYQRPRSDFTYVINVRDTLARLHQLLGDRSSVTSHFGDLQHQVLHLEWERDTMRERLSKAEMYVGRCEEEKKVLEQKYQDCMAELQQAAEREQVQKQEVQELHQQVTTIQNAASCSQDILQEKEKQLRDMLAKVDQLEEEKQDAGDSLETAVTKIEHLERERCALEESLDQVQRDLADADSYYRRLHDDLATQLQQLELQVAELRQENSKLIVQTAAAQEDIQKLQNECKMADDAVKKAVYDRDLAEKQLLAIEKDVDYQRTRAEKLLKLLREKDSTEASASEMVAHLQSQLELSQNEICNLQQTFSILQHQEAEARDEVAACRSQLFSLTQECATKAERITFLEEQVTTLKQNIISQHDDFLEVEKMMLNLKQELLQKVDLENQQRSELLAAASENEALKQQLQMVTERWQQAESDRNCIKTDLTHQLEHLQKQLEESRLASADVEKQLVSLREQNQQEGELRQSQDSWLRQLQQQLGEWEAYCTHLAEQKQQLDEQNRQLQLQCTEHAEQRQEAWEDSQQLHARISSLEQQLSAFTEQSAQENELKVKLEARVAQLQLDVQSQKDAFTGDVKSLHLLVEAERQRCVDLDAEVQATRTAILASEAEKSQFLLKLRETEKQLSEVTQAKEEMTRMCSDLQSELSKTLCEMEEKQSQLSYKDEAFDNVGGLLALSQAEVERLKEDLSRMSENSSALHAQNAILQQELHAANQSLNVTVERNRRKEFGPSLSHPSSTADAVRQLSGFQASESSTAQEVSARLVEMQKLLKKKDAKVTSLTKQLTRSQDEVLVLSKQLEQAREEIVHLHSQATQHGSATDIAGKHAIADYFNVQETPGNLFGNFSASSSAANQMVAPGFGVEENAQPCEADAGQTSVEVCPSNINDEIAQLRSQLQERETHVADLTQTIKTFEQQLLMYGQSAETLQTQVDQLEEEKAAAEKLATLHASQNAELEDRLREALSVKEGFEKMVSSIQSELETKLSEALSGKAEADGSLKSLEQQLWEINTKLSEAATEKSEFENKVAEMSAHLTGLESRLSEELSEKGRLESEVSALSLQVTELRLQLSQVSSEKEGTEADAVKLNDHLTELGAKLSEVLMAKAEAENKVERLEQELKTVRESVVQLQSMTEQSSDELSKELHSRLEENAALQGQHLLLRQELRGAQDQLGLVQQEKDLLQVQLDSGQQELQIVKEALTNIQTERDTLQTELSSVQNLKRNLEEQLAQLKNESAMAKDRLSESQEARLSAESRTLQLERELQTLQETVVVSDSLMVDVAALKLEKSSHLQHIEELQSALADVSDKYNSLLVTSESDRAELEGAQKQLTTLDDHSHELEATVKKLTEQLEDAQSLYISQNKAAEALQLELSQTTVSLQATQSKLQEMEAGFSQELAVVLEDKQSLLEKSSVLEGQIVQLKTQLLDQSGADKDTQNLLASMSQQLAAKDQQVAELQQQLEVAGSKITDLSQKLHLKEEKMNSLVETMQDMEERLEQLTAEADERSRQTSISNAAPADMALHDELVALKADLTAKEESIAAREKVVSDKELTLKRALATVKKLKFQLEQANVQVQLLVQEKETLAQRLAQQQQHDEVSSLSERGPTQGQQYRVEEKPVGSAGDDTGQASGDPAQQLLEIQDLRAQLQAYSEYCQRLQEQVQTLTDSSQSAESAKLSAVQQQLKKEQQEVEEAKQEALLLQQQLSSTEQTLTRAREEIAALQEQLVQQKLEQAEAERMNQETEELKQQLSSVEQELASAQQETVSHQKRLVQMQDDLTKVQQENTCLQEYLRQVQEDAERTHNDLATLQLELDKAHQHAEKAQEDYSALHEDWAIAKQDAEKVRQDAASIQEQLEQTQEVANQAVEQCTCLKQMLREHEEQVQQLEQERDGVSGQLADLESLKFSVEEKSRQVEKLMLMVEDLQSSKLEQAELKDSLDGQLTSMLSVVETLRGTLNRRDEELEEIMSQMSSLKERLAEREGEVSDLQANLSAVQDLVAMVKSDLSAVSADFDDRAKDMQARINQLEQERSQLMEAAQAQKDRTQEVLLQLSDAQNKEVTLAAEMEVLRMKYQEQITSLSSEVADARHENGQLAAANTTLAAELEAKASQLQSLEDLKRQVQVLEADILSYQHQIERLTNNQSLNTNFEHEDESVSVMADEISSQIRAYQQEVQGLKEQLAQAKLTTEASSCEESAMELKRRLDEILTEKLEMETNVNSLQELLQHLQAEKSSLAATLEQVREELEQAQHRSSQKDEDLASLRSSTETLGIQLKRALQEKERLVLQKEQLETDCDALRGEIEGMEKVIAEAQFAETDSVEQRKQLKQDFHKVVQDNVVLKAQLAELQAASVQQQPMHTSENTGGDDSWDWGTQVIVEKPMVVQQSLQQMAAGPISSSSPSALEVKKQYEALQLEHDKVRNRLQVNEIKCEKMLAKLKAFKEKNERLQLTLDEARRSSEQQLWELRRSLEEQLQGLRVRLRDVETHNGQLIHENNTLKDSAARAAGMGTEELKRFQSMVDQLQSRCQTLEEEKASLESAYQHRLTEAEARVQEVHRDMEHQRMLTQDLQREVEKLKRQNDDQVQDASLAARHSQQLLEAEVESLQNQLKDLRQHHHMLQEDNNQYQEVLASLTATNKDLKRQVEQLQFDLSKATKSLLQSSAGNVSSHSDFVDSDRISQKDVQNLERQISQLETEKHDLTEELEGVMEEAISLRREKQVFSKRVEDVVHQISQLQEQHKAEVAGLQEQISGLTWKLEEASGLEEEMEELRQQLEASAASNSQSLAEMSKLTRSAEMFESLEAHVVELQEEVAQKSRELEETRFLMSMKKDETTTLQDSLTEADKESRRLKEALETQNKKVAELAALEEKVVVLTQELENSQSEVCKFRRQADLFTAKLDTVQSLEMDFELLSEEYQGVLRDKSALVQQIEDLHGRIDELSRQDQEAALVQGQQEHFQREVDRLRQRIVELEEQVDGLLTSNTRLKQDLAGTFSSMQRLTFQNQALQAQSQVATASEDDAANSAADYDRLQEQFRVVLDEKNKLQGEMHQAQYSLQQREARCQQLAMQPYSGHTRSEMCEVGQLVEDRTYLNTQLGTLSRSLREKEAEWSAMRQQYSSLHQAHIATQTKVGELERRLALESLQKDVDAETAAEADESRYGALQERLEALTADYRRAIDNLQVVEAQLAREMAAKDQAERALGEAQEHIRLQASGSLNEIKLEMEEEPDNKIPETSAMLTRHGMGYIQRLQRLLRVRSRQVSRLMRLRPGLRTIIWIYFVCLHLLIVACLTGIL